jgi:hypothetical protein
VETVKGVGSLMMKEVVDDGQYLVLKRRWTAKVLK